MSKRLIFATLFFVPFFCVLGACGWKSPIGPGDIQEESQWIPNPNPSPNAISIPWGPVRYLDDQGSEVPATFKLVSVSAPPSSLVYGYKALYILSCDRGPYCFEFKVELCPDEGHIIRHYEFFLSEYAGAFGEGDSSVRVATRAVGNAASCFVHSQWREDTGGLYKPYPNIQPKFFEAKVELDRGLRGRPEFIGYESLNLDFYNPCAVPGNDPGTDPPQGHLPCLLPKR